ncbi:MAG: nickel pincer cofactor biosynthesis protein LarB [Acidimicrobiales bacterium]|nr:nickel pincer cofactor biosynthesis protein LarB [Acidimicrobiales bacterium]
MHAITPDEAVTLLRRLPFADIGHTKVDHHRELRQGMAEAVYGPGKSPEEVAAIVRELLDHSSGPVVLTRANDEQIKAARAVDADVEQRGTILVWRPAPRRDHNVVVLTAGTADGPVADECEATLYAHGIEATSLRDVGVAGLHRLLAQLEHVESADVIVVVAGMEGALASVVTGLTAVPVVAVPTSTGYGTAFEGVTALLAMLSSCASGMSVVGIDNGFGAAAAAVRYLSSSA